MQYIQHTSWKKNEINSRTNEIKFIADLIIRQLYLRYWINICWTYNNFLLIEKLCRLSMRQISSQGVCNLQLTSIAANPESNFPLFYWMLCKWIDLLFTTVRYVWIYMCVCVECWLRCWLRLLLFICYTTESNSMDTHIIIGYEIINVRIVLVNGLLLCTSPTIISFRFYFLLIHCCRLLSLLCPQANTQARIWENYIYFIFLFRWIFDASHGARYVSIACNKCLWTDLCSDCSQFSVVMANKKRFSIQSDSLKFVD